MNYEALVTATDAELLDYLEGLNVTSSGLTNVLRNVLPRLAQLESATRPSQDPNHWNQAQAPTPTAIVKLEYRSPEYTPVTISHKQPATKSARKRAEKAA